MKHGAITLITFVLNVSILPPARGLASIDHPRPHASGTKRVTSASASARGLFQLAKKNDNDNDDDEEGEHKHSHRHHKHHQAAQERYEGQPFCGPYFNQTTARYFRDYYSHDDYANLPPGSRKHVQKTGHLPPGLEKKYECTGKLPPGLQKRFVCGQTVPADYSPYLYPVPDVAEEKIGPLPPDSKLYLYGNDLILLNDHTKAIIDILRGAY
jgi:hypothetical protein